LPGNYDTISRPAYGDGRLTAFLPPMLYRRGRIKHGRLVFELNRHGAKAENMAANKAPTR